MGQFLGSNRLRYSSVNTIIKRIIYYQQKLRTNVESSQSLSHKSLYIISFTIFALNHFILIHIRFVYRQTLIFIIKFDIISTKEPQYKNNLKKIYNETDS